jgi:hypothetical protein
MRLRKSLFMRKSLFSIATVVALGVVGLAGCGGGITVDGEVEATAPPSDSASALGGDASSGECTESASGIATGDTVTISGGDQALATGTLETGEFHATGLTCVFPFTVSDVEPGYESYIVSVRDESLTYSEEELRDGIGMMILGS